MFQTLGFLGNFGMMEMLVIGAIALLVFGNRLPSTMRSLGQSVVQFKKGLREGESGEGDADADGDKHKADAAADKAKAADKKV